MSNPLEKYVCDNHNQKIKQSVIIVEYADPVTHLLFVV